MLVPRKIIVHHSATKDSGTVSWQAIRAYHIEEKHWTDIGYHAGVEWVQSAGRSGFEALYGRPTTLPGAHTIGENNSSLAICFIGDYDAVEPSTEMLLVGVERVIVPWCRVYHLGAEQIHGHRDYASKTCPGTLFDLDVLRAMVAARI